MPPELRARDRTVGTGEPILGRYERIAFEKGLVTPPGETRAAFVCPGHPLLDATLDLTLERHRELLRRGAVLVDERDGGTTPRVLFTVEHAILDGAADRTGERRVVSERMLFVETDAGGAMRAIAHAPYLDYRPLREGEPAAESLLALPELAWVTATLEGQALGHAVTHSVPEHLSEVRTRRLAHVEKTRQAVHERLTKEIGYWDHRAEVLRLKEQAGKRTRLPASEARRRADSLAARLEARMRTLDAEAKLSARPPSVLSGLVVVPAGLLAQVTGASAPVAYAPDTQKSAARARAIVMDAERALALNRPTGSLSGSATTSKAATRRRAACALSRSKGALRVPTRSP